MSIRITEIKSQTTQSQPRVFKVAGTLHLKDAELLEGICRQVSTQTGGPLILELDEVCFVDSESAAILCRLKRENVVTIQGLTLFTGKVMELADEFESSRGAKCSSSNRR